MYRSSFERLVLLVEDNPSDERIASQALMGFNFPVKIHLAKDGQEALDFLIGSDTSSIPDLILLDQGLPKLNGLEVLQAIRERQKFEFVPIIMITSSDDREKMKQCYRLGGNGYVCKSDDLVTYRKNIELIGSYWLGININHRQIRV